AIWKCYMLYAKWKVMRETHIHTHTYTHTNAHTHMHTHTHAYTQTHTPHRHTHTRARAYTHTRIHTHTHTHMHTNAHNKDGYFALRRLLEPPIWQAWVSAYQETSTTDTAKEPLLQ